MDKTNFESPDLTQANIEKLKALFPSVVTESENGKKKNVVNFEALRQLLSSEILEGDEAYEFTWVGKKAAIVEAGRPIRKTLRPCEEESKNWDTTENLYIEGDNLDVLKLLQENYLGKVKMIYIDPPYNRGKDRLYPDNFKVDKAAYQFETGEVEIDENGEERRFFINKDVNGRFHSDWCSIMYPRLMLSRNLLSEDGVIFISCDDNEQENIKKMCNEIFGESNKVAEFVVIRAEGGGMAKHVIKGHDYLYVYAKNINIYHPLCRPKDIRGKIIEIDNEKYWIQDDWLRKEFGKYGNCHYEEILEIKGQEQLDEVNKGLKENRYMLIPKDNGMHLVGKLKKIAEDYSKFYSVLKYLSSDGIDDLSNVGLKDYFDYPKPVSLLYDLIKSVSFFNDDKNCIILDFFSGSATTAHAVMKLNAEDGGKRKFIMVQIPEVCPPNTEAAKAGYKNICEIGKERIRRAGENIKKDNADKEGIENLDTGFRVFKCDSSNMKDVYYTPQDTSQGNLRDLIDNIKENRSDLDLLFGCILDLGKPLSLKHETLEMDGHKAHFYDGNSLACCFAPNISENIIKEIAKRKPSQAVFRNSSFADSQSRINAAELFKSISPDTDIIVL